MQGVNATAATPDASMTLANFVEQVYLPCVERELRPSTHKGYRGVWRRYLAERIGSVRLRRFRTVDDSRLLRTLAEECGVNKTTLGHVKSVLSAIFTHAKNEGAYDGTNPVQATRIPRQARAAGETFAPTSWRRSCASWTCCPYCHGPWWRRRRLPGCARASCGAWSGRTTARTSWWCGARSGGRT
jgi:hypothetical protein